MGSQKYKHLYLTIIFLQTVPSCVTNPNADVAD